MRMQLGLDITTIESDPHFQHGSWRHLGLESLAPLARKAQTTENFCPNACRLRFSNIETGHFKEYTCYQYDQLEASDPSGFFKHRKYR